MDALGIVTLIGADEMNLVVGRLARSPYTKYLPLLGAYTVAGNSITKPLPGFAAYNITDRIMATDVTGWFGRWLMKQDLSSTSTWINISVSKKRTERHARAEFASALIGLLTMGPPLTLAVLIYDWWGLANYVSMIVSVLVRLIVVEENWKALDTAADGAIVKTAQPVKTFWTLPDGNAVTIIAPRGVIMDCLLTTPRPPNLHLYNAARGLGWAAFAVHCVSLGMATLVSQILTVVLLLGSTILVARKFLDDDLHVGRRLQFQRTDFPGKEFRSAALARLNLTSDEERSMVAWNLFPHLSNELWWERYHKCKKDYGVEGFKRWDQIMAERTDLV
ncbi:hypothetical protein BP5796_02794 [Coleophoma crateriformis]|uniref:Uncharacterized protein n=1 Tax=Coleophoma crateriformis TaxID=565419 RepID=A0A3D8SZF6_9HELO|nr:hypothetical protein BP5796_02794 [Coleophoma crateriformis]